VSLMVSPTYVEFLHLSGICVMFAMVCIQIEKLDRSRLQYLAYTARGCFAPLCAFLGGVVAQEALKALTGKFTPINQWVSKTRSYHLALIYIKARSM